MKSVAFVFTGILVLFTVMTQSGCTRTPITNVRVSDSSIDTAEPAIIADGEGNIYVAYVEHSEDKTADLFVHKYTPSLDQAGPSVQVNPIRGSVKTWAGDAPTIVIGPDNLILVGWTMRIGTGTNYVLSISHDGGKTFSKPTRINDDEAPVSHGMHSLSVDASGTIYAAWLDERNVGVNHAEASPSNHSHFATIDHKIAEPASVPEPNSEVFFAVSRDGGTTFSKNQRIARDVCPCCKTALVAANDGRVYVSWRQVLEGDYRHIAVAASSDGGKSFASGVIVSDDRWQLNACPVSGAAIQAGQGEDLKVAWYTAGDAGQAGYYFARSTNGGGQFGSRLLVTSDARSGTPVLLRASTGLVLIVPASENRTLIFASDDGGSTFRAPGIIEQASNPAAAIANGATYIAFVRTENNKRSVLIAKR